MGKGYSFKTGMKRITIRKASFYSLRWRSVNTLLGRIGQLTVKRKWLRDQLEKTPLSQKKERMRLQKRIHLASAEIRKTNRALKVAQTRKEHRERIKKMRRK